MLDVVFLCCKKWRMRVNVNKTKVVHHRVKGHPTNEFNFTYGNENIQIVTQYKYLGVIMDEHLDFNILTSTLASSAKRALGSIYTKYRNLKGLRCLTFTKMYHSGVTPILDYASGIWGYKTYEKIDTIQNRAIHLYLGVHAFAPNLAINVDMGRICSSTRRKLEMIRMWNRLIKMDNTHLTKKVFLCGLSCMGHNWNSEISSVLTSIRQEHAHQNKTYVNVNNARSSLCCN